MRELKSVDLFLATQRGREISAPSASIDTSLVTEGTTDIK